MHSMAFCDIPEKSMIKVRRTYDKVVCNWEGDPRRLNCRE